jgi:hypothetical protein
MPNARKGKIARAPFEVRTVVNQMLRDGATAKAIITFLESKDVFGINEQNVANWRDGGYQDWTRQQDRLEDMAAKREFAMEIVKQNQGSQLHEATLHLAASQLYEALTDFDLDYLKVLLAEKPENYAAIVNSLAKLSKGALDQQKYKDLVREQKAKIEAALGAAKSKGGLTPETLKTIEEAAAML